MTDLSDFVSAAVLVSEDGLSLKEEGPKGGLSRADNAVARDVAKLEGRTLYDQLQANKAKIEEDRLIKSKMAFGACVLVRARDVYQRGNGAYRNV